MYKLHAVRLLKDFDIGLLSELVKYANGQLTAHFTSN